VFCEYCIFIISFFLKCLFPDAYDLPTEEVEMDRETSSIKSSPKGSLSRLLATVLCIVNNDNGEIEN